MYWKPDKLLRVLLFWTSLTTLVFWLPLIRGAFDGASYHWALAPTISGSGMQDSYWVLVAGSSFALIVVFLGWRGARSPFRWLLLAWHSFLGIGSLYLAATQAESFVFRGDTLGISFSLAWVAPLTCGGFAFAAMYWVWRNSNNEGRRFVRPWGRSNTLWLLALGLLLPLQFILFRLGEPNSPMDQIGVIVTIGQWMLVGDTLSSKSNDESKDNYSAA